MANLPIVSNLTNRFERFNLPWLRLSIVAGVFLGSIFLALRAARSWSLAEVFEDPFVLLFPLAMVCLVFLRWPALGLVGLVIASLAVPFEINTGTQTRLNSVMLLLVLLIGLGIFDVIAQKRRITLISTRVLLPLLVFIAITIVSLLVGQLPWFVYADKASIAAQLGGLSIFLLSAGVFILVAGQLRDLRWLKWMTWIFIFLASLRILGELFPPLEVFTGRFNPVGTYSNSVFWVWLVALTASQAIFNRSLALGWRLALAGLVCAIFYVRIGLDSGWTSGWLPALATLMIILVISSMRSAQLVTLLGLVLAAASSSRVRDVLLGEGNDYSLFTRLEAWRIMRDVIQVNPIFGLGPANYYWYTPLYAILGYSVEFNSHNNYLDLLAQTGILGTVAFLWFVWELGRLGWRLRNQVKDDFARAYVYGALGGLGGMLIAGMLGDWFLPFVYNVGFRGFRASVLAWMFLGGLVAIEQIFTHRIDVESQADKQP